MIMSDNKKKASMIVASMGGPLQEDSQDESKASDGHDAAASEIMDAISSKDPAALKEALKSFVSMCMDEEDSEPADDSSEADSAE